MFLGPHFVAFLTCSDMFAWPCPFVAPRLFIMVQGPRYVRSSPSVRAHPRARRAPSPPPWPPSCSSRSRCGVCQRGVGGRRRRWSEGPRSSSSSDIVVGRPSSVCRLSWGLLCMNRMNKRVDSMRKRAVSPWRLAGDRRQDTIAQGRAMDTECSTIHYLFRFVLSLTYIKLHRPSTHLLALTLTVNPPSPINHQPSDLVLQQPASQ